MQKGFATLEIIFAVMIFALLAGAALPNATRVLEISSLDYETKRLYSELRFAQALSRGSKVETAPMGGKFEIDPSPGVTVTINSSSIRPDSWQVRLGQNDYDPLLREQHYLHYGEKFSFKGNLRKISFDSAGHPKDMNNAAASGTLTLTTRSRRDKSNIIFDSVGRILVGRDHD